MGIDYSAAVSYGFTIKESDLPDDIEDPSEFLSKLGISHGWAGSFYTGDTWIVICVKGTYTQVDYHYGDPVQELLESNVSAEDIIELRKKCEKAEIEWEEPKWLLTTLIS